MKTYRTRGLTYIAAQLQENGGIVSYSSSDPHDFRVSTEYRTTFFPSLVLGVLADMQTPTAQQIKDRLAVYLLTQKNDSWSYNYWDRTSEQYKQLPFPDDLDDTFCALSALWQYDKKLIGGDVLATVSTLLIQTEDEPGGPYRTWLIDRGAGDEWQDKDLAVNANIAYFLSLQDVELPGIQGFIERAIVTSRITSPYYPDSFPLISFIAHWYHGPLIETLIQRLLDQQVKDHWQTAQQTALALSSLVRLGYPVTKLRKTVTWLTAQQQADGSWPIDGFCIDPTKDGTTQYAGSAVLTTAVCLEALTLFEMTRVRSKIVKSERSPEYRQVVAILEKVIAAFPAPELIKTTRLILKRISSHDPDGQIGVLPWMTATAMNIDVDQSLATELALASFWGWMAYSVYDDFLDNEGDPKLLPAALVCFRQMQDTLRAVLPDNQAFQTEVATILHRIDAANAWEVSHCRGERDGDYLRLPPLPEYGDYWQLADRSLGHSIAALGVLYSNNSTPAQLTRLRDFFQHFLIARQLHDDAHDWEADLRLGHINAVAVPILKHWKKKTLQFHANEEVLRTIFWEHVIDSVAADILEHCSLARAALDDRTGQVSNPLLQLLISLEKGAQAAIEQRDETLAFIRGL
jgi:hypothetical protein